MAGFFKKPWWVGPLALVAGMAIGHTGAAKPPGLASVKGYEIIKGRGRLPRNGSIVVIARCPTGKQVIGGGYVAPSVADATDLSIRDRNNTWRVGFKSNGGSGDASVYAICATAKQAQRTVASSLAAANR
jgi:hypothetical protein